MTTVDLTGDPATFAVVGATGQQGGAVAAELLDRGQRVRALTRDPGSDAARALAAAGAEVVPADLDDLAGVRHALLGADGVFAMTTMTEQGPEGETRQGITLVDAAVQAGVPYLIYSSVGGAERDTGIPHFESKRRVEEHLEATDLPSTILRPVYFMSNLTRFGAPAAEDGKLVLRAPLRPETPLQMIAPVDIGKVAATLLLDPQRISQGALELAGDELTPEQIAAVFGAAEGMVARFEPVPLEALTDPDLHAMFAWFAELPAYQADFGRTRLLDPEVLTFAEFLDQERSGGPAGPDDDSGLRVDVSDSDLPRTARP